MPPPKISAFPLHKPFERLQPDTAISEIGLRLVADIYTDNATVLGTATLISSFMLLTARHVLEQIYPREPREIDRKLEITRHLSAVQLLPGPQYRIWDVVNAWPCPHSDLAILQLGINPGLSDPDKPVVWRHPQLNPFPPAIGERVAAFGYHSSEVRVSRNAEGGPHIELNDHPTASVGVVTEHYELLRDSTFLNFPTYQVSARFEGGMSGGPVFDETGALCGLVCANLKDSHLYGDPVSYVVSLWPMFRMIVSGNRAGNYPKNVEYQVIELVRGGQIHITEIDRFEAWLVQRAGLIP